jgi:hypothetical protein
MAAGEVVQPATVLRSTSASGAANLSFISGIRLWPPARTFASPSNRSRSSQASSRVVGAKYSNLAGYTRRPLLPLEMALTAAPQRYART